MVQGTPAEGDDFVLGSTPVFRRLRVLTGVQQHLHHLKVTAGCRRGQGIAHGYWPEEVGGVAVLVSTGKEPGDDIGVAIARGTN